MHVPRSVALLVSTLLCGCVPFPNVRYYAPAVSGTVTQGSKPVVGAEIRVRSQFSSEVRIALSDQDGRFGTESIRKLLATATLLGDPLYGYSVEIVFGGIVYAGYTESSVGYGPKEAQLRCDLYRPVERGSAKLYCTTQQAGTDARAAA